PTPRAASVGIRTRATVAGTLRREWPGFPAGAAVRAPAAPVVVDATGWAAADDVPGWPGAGLAGDGGSVVGAAPAGAVAAAGTCSWAGSKCQLVRSGSLSTIWTMLPSAAGPGGASVTPATRASAPVNGKIALRTPSLWFGGGRPKRRGARPFRSLR